MLENPRHLDGCPSLEQITAYFDQESKMPEQISSHLKNCEKCKKYFKSLSLMDYSLKHVVRKETGSDSEISKRILAGVRDSIKKERKKKLLIPAFSPVQWRAASLFLFAGLLGYFVWDEYSESAAEPVVENRIVSSAAIPAVITASPAGGTVQVSELTTVKFSSDGTELPVSLEREYLPIREYVRHIWKGAGDPEKEIPKILMENKIENASLSKTENGWKLTFKGTKQQVIQFVRSSVKNGMILLSPDQPQPEQNTFSGKADDLVFYSASYPVSRNK